MGVKVSQTLNLKNVQSNHLLFAHLRYRLFSAMSQTHLFTPHRLDPTSQTQSLHSVAVSLSFSSSHLSLGCLHTYSVPGTIRSPPVNTDQPNRERISKIIEPSPELPNQSICDRYGIYLFIYLFKQGPQMIRISKYGKQCLGHPSLQSHRLYFS